ncbi:hypothetical protein BH24BAC1_BH24BAC1_40610 [soil metagenome]
MVVGHIKKIMLPLQDLPLSVGSLTLRAVPVAAAVVMQLYLSTTVTGLMVPSKGSCSALLKSR